MSAKRNGGWAMAYQPADAMIDARSMRDNRVRRAPATRKSTTFPDCWPTVFYAR